MSAYACGPDAGPEASAGWEFARAAARTCDVWVITRPRFEAGVTEALRAEPDLAEHLHMVYYDPSARVVRMKRRAWDLYWFYPLWQRGLGRVAQALHAEVGFDVAHHVTFANDWMPAGVRALRDVPFVWGPVGGSSSLPIARLARWLGVRGVVTELVRTAVTRPLRAVGGDPTGRRAALVVAQNPQVAEHFARLGATTVVEPNATLDDLPPRAAQLEQRTAVFAGRLLAWKGAALAIDALAHPLLAGWRLHVYGSGYDLGRLRRRARRQGVADRVEFRGHAPRADLLAAIARAEVFLFPSMHDQAGWVVAEATSMGCPVVCLPLGGPPVLAQPNAHVAALSGDIVRNVAVQVRQAAAQGGVATDRWSIDRLPGVVAGWYAAVAERAAASAPAAAPGERPPLVVLESFSIPKPTTNPYITQLYRSLSQRVDVEVIPFDYRSALWGRYDVAHLHWPELMMGGHRWIGRAARRTLTAAVIVRWRLTRTPVVRTMHNLERPTNIDRIDNWLLDRIDALTALDIRLNERTPQRSAVPGTVIPHGHYRDWFGPLRAGAETEPVSGRIVYAGLVRRYKGVEDLVAAFTGWDDPSVSLHIAGKPSTADLAEGLRASAQGDARVSFDLRFLEEPELVQTITSAELVVLPYRHMHNSGTALAALSLGRPVLVPDNDVNRDLAREVGPGWVHLFSGALTTDVLAQTLRAAQQQRGRPDLSAREWPESARAHVEAFHRAHRAHRGERQELAVG
ncbi:glycosyltransferase [Microbacterium sp. zg.Y1090]|uniref:glycosyltransferase n=1 Tax=Microbacterium wangruii TaxID=3049073 RepID=UPI00214D60C2|nr:MULTISPECIES: glycosyltransferase [unclassified Microbacterium]MCR2820017.1 glycosyltransferase [Microbacterium sp. zg.Y1090]WIM27968.1 glycosyltransferase [Microbacterium sp. zg-Y1090]